jgi:peptidoglycan/LPS O-acetylase OafA/YrhL
MTNELMSNMTKERLLYIDILKIIGILMVIVQHISSFYPQIIMYYRVYGPYGICWGYIGVAIFIFSSGASLTLANKNPRTIKETMIFFKNRVIRIYPAFWMSILLAIAISSWPRDFTLWDMFTTFCGFHEYLVLFGYASSNLNLTWWFIGLIMILYLLYPFLSWIMNRQPEIAITVSAIVSIASLVILMTDSLNSYILHMDPQNLGNLQYRFPLGWLFYMTLGMYIAKKKIYPRIYNNYKSIMFMADLSFFIYLVHGPLIQIAKDNLGVFSVLTIALALLLYTFDLEIKKIDLISVIDPWFTRLRNIFGNY